MPLCNLVYDNLRTVDRGGQAAPGLPCAHFQLRVRRRSKARANTPRGCEGGSAIRNANGRATLPPTDSVIATGPKQSSLPPRKILECFAALAMTRMMEVSAAEIAKLLTDFDQRASRAA